MNHQSSKESEIPHDRSPNGALSFESPGVQSAKELIDKSRIVMDQGNLIQRIAQSEGTIQLKEESWEFDVRIVEANGSVVEKKFTVKYDDEKGITIKDIKILLHKTFGDLYMIKFAYLGTSTERDRMLNDDSSVITYDFIKTGGKMVMAGLKSVKDLEEKKEEEKPKSRSSSIIKKSELVDMVKEYGFNKIVTGNHINSAKKVEDKINEGVVVQQEKELSGSTLFIDPLFQEPGAEGQFYDIMMKEGAKSTKIADGFWTIELGGIKVGALSKGVYTDEVDTLGVKVAHYITQVRPKNILEE